MARWCRRRARRPGAPRWAARSAIVPCGLRCASISSATWRSDDLAQRGEVLGLEEVGQRGVDSFGRVDLAGAQPLAQRLGRDVEQHHLVGACQHSVGERLPHARAGELGDLIVERLQVLDVDGREHVDPRVEHGRRRPRSASRARHRGRWCGRARRSGRARARGGGSPADPSRRGPFRGRSARAGGRPRARRPGQSSRRGHGARGSRSRRRVRPRAPPVPPGACGRSCRRPAAIPRKTLWRPAGRGHRSCAEQLWTTRSMSLIPMNGAISPPSP